MALRLGGLADLDPTAVPLPVGTEVTTRVDRGIREKGASARVRAVADDRVEVVFLDGQRATFQRAEVVPLARSSEYIYNILMPTSVHIPKPLLAAVDRKAKALRISRNRLIVEVLERELEREWSPGFFETLDRVDAETAETFRASMEVVVASRRSKKPPEL